jgi:hypothetical protein
MMVAMQEYQARQALEFKLAAVDVTRPGHSKAFLEQLDVAVGKIHLVPVGQPLPTGPWLLLGSATFSRHVSAQSPEFLHLRRNH